MKVNSFFSCSRLGLYIALLLLGAMGTLAFAPINLWFCAFISIMGLLWCTDQRPYSLSLSFSWGIGFFLSGIYWIYFVIQYFGNLPIPIALAILILFACYLTLFPLLFTFILQRYFKQRPFIRLVIAAPALWLLTEALRGTGLLGFPWLLIGYTQLNTPLANFAPILGVNGISYLVLLICGLTVYACKYRQYIFLGLIVPIILLSYSLGIPKWVTVDHKKPLNIALVQGNIPNTLTWQPNYLEHTLLQYSILSMPYIGKNQLIVWPEGAIPDLQSNQYDFLKELDELGKQKNTSFIIGTFTRRGANTYNSMLALGATLPAYHTQTVSHYDKHHLVPFGEFIPFKEWLQPFMRWFDIPMSNLSPGPYHQAPLTLQGFHFLPAICFDIVFNQQMQANFQEKDDFILLISNDGWFGDSTAPWQHLEMSQMRALELGRPVLIDTTNGVTAIIDSKGEIIQQLPQFTTGVLSTTVYATTGQTPFARFGNLPILMIVLTTLAFSLWLSLRHSKNRLN